MALCISTLFSSLVVAGRYPPVLSSLMSIRVWLNAADLFSKVGIDSLLGIKKDMECDLLRSFLKASSLALFLMKEFGLSAWDVNTGKAFVYPSDVADVRKYIEMGVR